MSDNPIAFTSRNYEILLVQDGKIFSVASVEEAKVLLKQLKAAIVTASVESTRKVATEHG